MRGLVGAALVVVVVAVALVSLRLYAEGPDWGIQLGFAPDGRGVVATDVRGEGVGWQQRVRPGFRVLSVDGTDPSLFVGRGLGDVTEMVVADESDQTWTARPPELSDGLKLWLVGIGVLLSVLGAAVYRWAADPALGRVFLVFSGATALALAIIPGCLRGNPLATFLAANAAIVAVSGFTAVFFWFPRRLRLAGRLTATLAIGTACLLAPLAWVSVRDHGIPPLLDSALFVWFGGNLVAGAVVLAARATQPANRHALAPLAFGIAIGVLPLAMLNALPQALGRPWIVRSEDASAGVAAVPVAFAYAILRHRLFALDAYMRRSLVRAATVAMALLVFSFVWLVLRRLDMDDGLAGVLAVVAATMAVPEIDRYTHRVIESWLYPSLRIARTAMPRQAPDAATLASSLVTRVRELVPTRWAALLVLESDNGWRVLAADGETPDDLTADLPAEATTVPLHGSPTLRGAVCVGPRLDCTSIGGVDVEAIQMVGRAGAPSIDAALLREHAENESRFREGLSRLARDLAAAGSTREVLRVTADHAPGLLDAERARIWLRDTSGEFQPLDADPGIGPPDPETDVDAERRPILTCRLGEWGAPEALLVIARPIRARAFTEHDRRRIGEVADHVNGALGRAHMSAQAAEVEAMRDVDRLRSELVGVVAHEIRNPLTVVLGYADLLRRSGDNLDHPAIVRIADQIWRSASMGRDMVTDLSTAAAHDAGRLKLRAESIDLESFLTTLAQGYRVLPGGERIEVEVAPGLGVRADPTRLEQMVGNLVLNALRYAPTGPIELRAHEGGPGEACIEVIDHGPGIPTEAQARVWEKFYRVPGTEHLARGTGLGLSVVRTLADLHGGRVELESQRNQGSTFRIVLPRAQ